MLIPNPLLGADPLNCPLKPEREENCENINTNSIERQPTAPLLIDTYVNCNQSGKQPSPHFARFPHPIHIENERKIPVKIPKKKMKQEEKLKASGANSKAAAPMARTKRCCMQPIIIVSPWPVTTPQDTRVDKYEIEIFQLVWYCFKD